MQRYLLYFLLIVVATATLMAQQQPCLDASEEPHHHQIYQDSSVRIYTLDLNRLESTKQFCYQHAVFYIVLNERRTSDTPAGQATYDRDWKGGESRFVYGPGSHLLRNELSTPHHRVIVETLRTVQYQIFESTYDADALPDRGATNGTWQASFNRGALSAVKTQLASKDSVGLSDLHQLLAALTDLSLEVSSAGKVAKEIHMGAGEVQVLPGGENRKLLNSGTQSAKFVTVEF